MRGGGFETDVLAGDNDIFKDEAGVFSEAVAPIEVPEGHDNGTDLELDHLQRQAGEFQGVQELNGVVRSKSATLGRRVGAERSALLSGHAMQNVLIHVCCGAR